jgi:hypothetical protein
VGVVKLAFLCGEACKLKYLLKYQCNGWCVRTCVCVCVTVRKRERSIQ